MSDLASLSSKNLPAPRFMYSPIVRAGSSYYTAGMIGLKPETGELASGGVKAQTSQILRNLAAALPDFGLSIDDMIGATVYCTEFNDFGLLNEAWEEVFSTARRLPTRTAVGVSSLPLNASVEMEFSFYMPDRPGAE